MKKLNKIWFDKSLIVGGSPRAEWLPSFRNIAPDVIISVDSNYDSRVRGASKYYKISHFWFPMNECSADMGINSIYAAMQILWDAEKNNKKVYLHCAAGINRSPTVKECYYYMRTGEYQNDVVVKCDPNIQKMFIGHENETHYINRNKLLQNIESGFLPAKHKMELFLTMLNMQLNSNNVDLEQLKLSCQIS